MIRFTEIHFTQGFPGTLQAGRGQEPYCTSVRGLGEDCRFSESPVYALMDSGYHALAESPALPLTFWHELQRPFPLTFSFEFMGSFFLVLFDLQSLWL